MQTRQTIAIAALAVLMAGIGQAALADDYSDAYQRAKASGSQLLVTVGLPANLPPLAPPSVVLCRLPSGASHVVTGRKLAAHQSLQPMEGDGAFVVDTAADAVVIALPKRHCTVDGLWNACKLPAGSLTQRTLIWAVRMHPECPHSTDCTPDYRLFAQATAQCEAQATHFAQQHWLRLPACATSEIVAESWTHNVNVVDGAIELVHSWRRSPGHWRRVASSHQSFGYDMKRGYNRQQCGFVWYGTGVFYQ